LIDWSYDLLSHSERLLLRRLSVFAGDWTLEACEEVCAQAGIVTNEIMDLLGQLVNKSLVAVIECSDCSEIRYRMLETIRQYAREKLLETGGSESVHARHLAYFVKLAERAGPELTRSNQAWWLNHLEDDLDNLRMALEWSLASEVEAGLRLLVATWPFWEARGNPRELTDWLRNLLDRYSPQDALRARALAIYAWRISLQDDFAQARRLGEQSLNLIRAIHDQTGEAFSLLWLGVIAAVQGDLENGIRIVEESLAISRDLGDKLGQATATGWLSLNHNDLERSKALLMESLRLCRELGHLSGIANNLRTLAQRTIWGGDFSTPVAWLEEALRLYHELGDLAGEASVLQIYGVLAYWQGDYSQACKYNEKAIELGEITGNHIFVLWAHAFLAYATMRQGNFQKAKELFEFCIRDCQKRQDLLGLIFSIEGLASLYLLRGQPQRSVRLFAWTDTEHAKASDPRPPIEQAAVEKDLAKLQSQLDATTYASLSAEGQAMTREQAIAAALED
jgi:non-specific serine/threonine protein kinase